MVQRRKVRCDEGRPVCANCIRLRLDCEYVSGKMRSERTSPSSASSTDNAGRRTMSLASRDSFAASQQSPTAISSSEQIPSIQVSAYNAPDHQWSAGNDLSSSFATHLPENFLPSSESFDVGFAFTSPVNTYLPTDTFSTSSNHPATGKAHHFNDELFHGVGSPEHDRCQKLLEHFVQSVDPTKLIQPTHTGWPSTCRSILSMAHECTYLLSAICSVSALHLCCTAGEESFDEAFKHYKFASRGTNSVLNQSHSDDSELKQAFTATFILSYIEVCTPRK